MCAPICPRSERSPSGSACKALKSFARWCVEDGLAENDPLAQLSYIAQPETTSAPVAGLADIEAVLDTCADDLEGHRDRAIICLLRCTGMRRGELSLLRWPDIDFATNTITLRHDTTKAGKSRQIAFDQEARTALRR
jgi:integrase